MTGVGDTPRDLADFIGDTRRRLVSLERQIVRARGTSSSGGGGGGGGTGGIQSIIEGYSIDITGAGSIADPMIINVDPSELMPPLPVPWNYSYNGAAIAVDGAAAVWTDIAVGLSYTITVAQPLWVMVEMSAYVTGATSTYGMIGVQATGALTLEPEVGLDGAGQSFGFTAYGEIGANQGKTLTAHKPLLLPAGATTLKMRKRRNVTTGSPTIGYPTMIVTPIMWSEITVPVGATLAAVTKRYLTESKTYPAVDTPLNFDLSVANSGHFTYNPTTAEHTCVIPGQYAVSMGLGGGQVSAENWIKGTVLHNGVIAAEFIGNRELVGGRAYHCNQTLTLATGDKIQVTTASNVAGGAITVSGGRSYIELVAVTTSTLDSDLNAVTTTKPGVRMTSGTELIPGGALATGGTITVPITFPPGLFTVPPAVVGNVTNSRMTVGIAAATTVDGTSLSCSNWSTGSMPGGNYVHWIAIGT